MSCQSCDHGHELNTQMGSAAAIPAAYIPAVEVEVHGDMPWSPGRPQPEPLRATDSHVSGTSESASSDAPSERASSDADVGDAESQQMADLGVDDDGPADILASSSIGNGLLSTVDIEIDEVEERNGFEGILWRI